MEIPSEQWELVLKEREAHYKGSTSYTWKEVKNMEEIKKNTMDYLPEIKPLAAKETIKAYDYY